MFLYSILNHSFHCIIIRRGNCKGVLINPLLEKLLIRLCNDEIVFIGSESHLFSIGYDIILPIEGLPIVRMEVH
jgi:hypothetical protein